MEVVEVRVEQKKKKRKGFFFFYFQLPLPSLSHLEQLGRDELAHTASRSRDEHELSGLDDGCARSDD